VDTSLQVHSLHPEEAYILGIFLVGAYQEILGDLHNLFGDTHAVNVELTADGGHRLVDPEYGDCVEDTLNYVHFDVEKLREQYRQRLRNSGLDAARQEAYLEELQAGLRGYTYLE
jgi:arginine decarboxylase